MTESRPAGADRAGIFGKTRAIPLRTLQFLESRLPRDQPYAATLDEPTHSHIAVIGRFPDGDNEVGWFTNMTRKQAPLAFETNMFEEEGRLEELEEQILFLDTHYSPAAVAAEWDRLLAEGSAGSALI